ncbi:MAG: hypothetical protein NVS2B16_28860 [Chloroflexota bacterium]
MTVEQEHNPSGDERHDFRAGTISATDDQIVDDEQHKFTAGRLSGKDDADQP